MRLESGLRQGQPRFEMLGLIRGALGRGGLCGIWLGMELGAHKEANAASHCNMGPFSPAQAQFSMETPNQMVLFYPGYYSTNNTQVLHTFASLLCRERSRLRLLGLISLLKADLLACPGALQGVVARPDSLSFLTCNHQGVFNMTYIKPLYLDCSTVLHNGFFVILPAN